MSQKTVKINTGFSDKVSENYNSQAFSVNLEMTVAINGSSSDVENAADRLFNLCKKIVEKQKGVASDPIFGEPSTIPSHAPTENAGDTNSPIPATDKQVKAIFGIGKGKGLDNKEIRSLADRFNKNIEQLSKTEASSLIQELTEAA